MVCELTGLAIIGSSMLDRPTAAAEAMTLSLRGARANRRRSRRRRRAAADAGSGAHARPADRVEVITGQPSRPTPPTFVEVLQ